MAGNKDYSCRGGSWWWFALRFRSVEARHDVSPTAEYNGLTARLLRRTV
jgi:hypothetical protein